MQVDLLVPVKPLGRAKTRLRCDVDTAADLAVARELGLGRFTRAALSRLEFGDFTLR